MKCSICILAKSITLPEAGKWGAKERDSSLHAMMTG